MPEYRKLSKNGGQDYHIADCYVWAAIYYLDSRTDYREYLDRHQQQSLAGRYRESMTFLDGTPDRAYWISVVKSLLSRCFPRLFLKIRN